MQILAEKSEWMTDGTQRPSQSALKIPWQSKIHTFIYSFYNHFPASLPGERLPEYSGRHRLHRETRGLPRLRVLTWGLDKIHQAQSRLDHCTTAFFLSDTEVISPWKKGFRFLRSQALEPSSVFQTLPVSATRHSRSTLPFSCISAGEGQSARLKAQTLLLLCDLRKSPILPSVSL